MATISAIQKAPSHTLALTSMKDLSRARDQSPRHTISQEFHHARVLPGQLLGMKLTNEQLRASGYQPGVRPKCRAGAHCTTDPADTRTGVGGVLAGEGRISTSGH